MARSTAELSVNCALPAWRVVAGSIVVVIVICTLVALSVQIAVNRRIIVKLRELNVRTFREVAKVQANIPFEDNFTAEYPASPHRSHLIDAVPFYESRRLAFTAAGTDRLTRQVDTDCPVKISGAGEFSTPYYPNLVGGNFTCFWQISVIYFGQTIQLVLEDLPPSNESACGEDYVAVADITGRVVRYCGSQSVSIQPGENVYVWTSGHGTPYKIKASFSSTFSPAHWSPPQPVCGGQLLAGTVFTSPHYPDVYPSSLTCFWVLEARPANPITLTFEDFDLGNDTACLHDYMMVWTSEKGLLGRFCGQAAAPNITTQSLMFVFFSSDNKSHNKGFRARLVNDACQGQQACTAGPPGSQGPQGPSGPKGAKGAVGPQGNSGPGGKSGSTGLTGPQGQSGSTGPAGQLGAVGAAGSVGEQGGTGRGGSTGEDGPAGRTGDTGQTGSTGTTGPAGITGSSGNPGLPGLSGATGATGNKGRAGPKGVTGNRGATGPAAAPPL